MDIAQNNKFNILLGIIITLVAALALYLQFPFAEGIEAKLLDYRYELRGTRPPPDNIVIAAIDEKSIERLGRFPWSRDKEALLVEKLTDAGAEIIAFDMFLSESEKNDKVLANAIRNAGNVVLPLVFEEFSSRQELPLPDNKFLKDSAFISIKNPERFKKYSPIMAQKLIMPVPELISQAMSLGQINMFPDEDGTLRWETLAIGCDGFLFPSLTLKVAAAYLGVPQDKLEIYATEGVRLGKRFIPTDKYGRTLINYYGPDRTFPHISISDILEGRVKQEALQGKIILIGATAVGIYDLRVTPLAAAMPGVEKHANVIASILQGRLLRAAPLAVNLAILLFVGILFSLLVTRFKAAGALAAAVLFLLGLLSSGYLLFVQKGLWINLTYPSFTVLLIFTTETAYSYAVSERYARRIRAMFSSYVTERVVAELIKNPDMARLGGERREITVLFSDVRGFTTFSEKHAPEEVVAILNEYLGNMTEIVFKWEGTLDKFIGDAILAFWNAPMRQENHAELAVRCALDMISRLSELRKRWESEGRPGLDIGIGINTGEVIVGNIGAEGKKMDYTVIGDHVNLGSRIESLTRKYDVHILITEFSLERIREKVLNSELGHVCIRGLEKVIVKGKEKPVGIYELVNLEPGARSTLIECEEEKVVRHKEK